MEVQVGTSLSEESGSAIAKDLPADSKVEPGFAESYKDTS